MDAGQLDARGRRSHRHWQVIACTVCCEMQEFVEGVNAGQLVALREQDRAALDAQSAHTLVLEVPALPMIGVPKYAKCASGADGRHAQQLPTARFGSLT